MKQSAIDRQRQIYLNGFNGEQPVIPIHHNALEQAARKCISKKAFAYIAGGAGVESTVKRNIEAFNRYAILPRMLRNVGERNTSISLLGKERPSPFLLSPVGVLEMVNNKADLAVARAAASVEVPYIFSNQASYAMESCAAEMHNAPHWFQLYWSKSKKLVASFIQRAEQCGCEAIVVTLDTTMLGWRTRDLELAYLPFLEGKGIAQYTSDPVFQQLMDETSTVKAKRKITLQTIKGLIQMVNNYPGTGFFKKLKSGRPLKAVQTFTTTYTNPYTTWEDLQFLKTLTNLPIFLKGIQHPDDAQKAIDYGIDGIIVSNHGGRQVDGGVSTIEILPAIANVVQKRIPVLLDSGIRGGADAFKALALGADAVCLGRPYVYALALAGEEGVRQLLLNYRADFELTMALSGCKSVAEIKPNTILNA
jgi:lactate 2-monooxygenase